MKKTFCEFLWLQRVHYWVNNRQGRGADYGVSQSLAQRFCTFERRQARIDQGVRNAEDAARAPDCEESVSATTRDDCALRRRYGSTPKYMFHLLQSSTSANYLVSI